MAKNVRTRVHLWIQYKDLMLDQLFLFEVTVTIDFFFPRISKMKTNSMQFRYNQCVSTLSTCFVP